MLLTPEEVREITAARLGASRADGCIVRVGGSDSLNLRFARNSATTNGAGSEVSVTIVSQIGQRSGSVTVTSLDAGALAEAQARSEAIARLAPEDSEQMPPLGAQDYETAGASYDDATAAVHAASLAAAAKTVIGEAVAKNVDAAGFAKVGASFQAMATSTGLFAYDRETAARFSATARNKAGTWSGWSGASEFRFDRLDAGRIARRAIGKSAQDMAPVDLDPGKYTVILEPAAVGELVQWLLWSLDARQADEGRGFMSRKGGGNRLGEKLFGETVTITSDPHDAAVPAMVYGEDGLPQRRTVWVENGVVKNLCYSRYWARKMEREPLSSPGSLVMTGGTASIEDMIRGTKRGILVTRVWYTNIVDPQTLLLTGLTRDGNFLIENGQIVAPARNLRFNESLVAMLSSIIAAGPSERSHGGDIGEQAISVPPLMVDGFTFSSRSSGI